MGQPRRPSKRRRLSRPCHLLGFSPSSRFLIFSRLFSSASAAPNPSPSYKESKDGIVHPKRPKNIKPIESSSDDEDNVDDYEEEEEQQGKIGEMQVDFAFFDPKPGDFHGVKLLLQSYLDNKAWDLSGFVDLILEQTTVGTVVKLADDDEEEEGASNGGDDDSVPFGVISALNLGRYAEHKCIREVKEFLIKVCCDDFTKRKLKSFLEEQASDVGLLVSQRYVNCPHQLVPHIYDALFDEVSWATTDEPTKVLQDSFRFKSYLLITKIYENKSINQRNARVGSTSEDPVIYKMAEDEIFHELSLLSFTFHLHAERLVPQELKSYKEKGLVMVVKADQVPKFRQKLKSLMADS